MPNSYNLYLDRCKELGDQAAALGEPPVGCVIVKDGTIVGEGREAVKSNRDVTNHAEIEAIRDAVQKLDTIDLSDCTLVTTHEPCVMCAYVIRYHKIPIVVYEHQVHSVGGINSQFPVLTDATFWKNRPTPKVIHLQK